MCKQYSSVQYECQNPDIHSFRCAATSNTSKYFVWYCGDNCTLKPGDYEPEPAKVHLKCPRCHGGQVENLKRMRNEKYEQGLGDLASYFNLDKKGDEKEWKRWLREQKAGMKTKWQAKLEAYQVLKWVGSEGTNFTQFQAKMDGLVEGFAAEVQKKAFQRFKKIVFKS
jgi:hypothetical protein